MDGRTSVSVPGAYGVSLTGRRDNNEDAILAVDLGDALLLAVADGLGGHAAGEVASALAVETLRETVASGYRPEADAADLRPLLRAAFAEAHRRVLREATGAQQGMGTTLVAALVRGDRAVVANCGDSRAYVIGDGVRFRTRDHSFVQDMVDAGVITEEAARRHPMRTVVTHTLGGALAVDLSEIALCQGEVLLLCSDGVSDVLDDGALVGCAAVGGPEAIAEVVSGRALETATDNVSVVVYRR